MLMPGERLKYMHLAREWERQIESTQAKIDRSVDAHDIQYYENQIHKYTVIKDNLIKALEEE